MKKISQIVLTVVVILFIASKCDSENSVLKNKERDSARQNIKKINTAGWEDSPFVSLDGKRLYFMYTPHNFYGFLDCMLKGNAPLSCAAGIEKRGPDRPGHIGNPNAWDDSNIYLSMRSPNGSWSAPQHLAKGCCAMESADDKYLYFQKANPANEGKSELCFASLNGSKVGECRTIDVLNSPSDEQNPHITNDKIYFESDRPGGVGRKDLYVATRNKDGSWNIPENLGEPINSKEDEEQVWVSANGLVMYFNRGGKIWRSEYKEEKWQVPQIVKLPLPENSFMGEASLTEDENELYFMLMSKDDRDINLVYTRKQADGSWGPIKDVDQ